MIAFIFWGLLFLIFYTYAGYPILVWTARQFFGRPVKKGPFYPPVSFVISAFNEAKYIELKLENLLKLDYPQEKVEILIGSDGASDGTDEIIAKFPTEQIRFFRFVKNGGKPQVLNALVRQAKSPYVIFTDARQRFDAQAILRLVENFNDPEVGCVSGELEFEAGEFGSVGQGMDNYWRYEKFLRKQESDLGSMLGATGAIYAIRRDLYAPIPTDILVDDMYIPLSLVRKGYRAIFDKEAKAYDRPSEKSSQEFKRKIRTLSGNWQIIQSFPDLVKPWCGWTQWQFFSHKLMRLLAPFFLAGLFLSNLLLLNSLFYRLFFFSQCLFYGLAGTEYILAERIKMKSIFQKLTSIPYTFCLLNGSAFLAFFDFFKKRPNAAWEKAYGS